LNSHLTIKPIPDLFAVSKLAPDQDFPSWLPQRDMVFIARTSDELSIMCPQKYLPAEQTASRGWHCLRIDGELAFDEVGVVARIAKPLADIGLSIFVVSTHDRDYVLVEENDLEIALKTYEQAGFKV